VSRPDRLRVGDASTLAAACLLAALLALALRWAPGVAGVEMRLRDMVHAYAYPKAPVSDRVVLVTVGEAELSSFAYRSPIDRAHLAEVIRSLDAKGPAAIGVDLLFDQPTEPRKDAMLREALRSADAPIVLARHAKGQSAAQIAWSLDFADGLPFGEAAVLFDREVGAARAVDLGPKGAVALSARLAGLADPDASTRTGRLRLAFSPPEPGAARFPSFPSSAAALLPEDWIRDRVVLVGVDAPGIDRHRAPVAALDGGEMAGVALQAQLVQQLLDGRVLRETPTIVDVAIAIASAALAGVAAGAPSSIGARIGLLAGLTLGAALLPALALNVHAIRGPVAAPLLAVALGGGAISLRRWRQDVRARMELRSAFERYLAPAVVARISARPDDLALDGEKRPLSFIFTDVAGFTALSEKTEPEIICRLLNRYLAGVTEVLLAHGATLDKFVGDAVISFFNAPERRDDHAAAAIGAAIAVDAFARRFAREAALDGVAFGATRIGVHTGMATVGNFGGDRFMDYTAIGDAVNLAARLEAANKGLGTRICVSGDAVAAAGAALTVPLRPIGEIRVKGREQTVAVFQPLTDGDAPERLAEYRRALALASADPAGALAILDALSAHDPDDRVVGLHRRRLRTVGAAGPIDLEAI
jgi:class 3 adenylate cyclase